MKIIKTDNMIWHDEPDREKEISVHDLFNDVSQAITENKDYGQLEKLEAKINIIFSILATQISKESMKTALQYIADEVDDCSYNITDDST